MNKLTNKCVAAIASLAMAGTLCVAGAVTMASVAWGGPPPVHQNPVTPKAPWDKDNKTTTGSITIVNCDAAEVDGTQGTSQCPAKHKPLKATFKVTKVEKVNNETLNYKSESDWAKLADVVNDLNRNDETKITLGTGDDNVKTGTTDEASGKTEFTGLSLGLYKVEETQAPAGYGANDMSVFYITLPLIKQVKDATGNTYKTEYDYKPVVHPKNKNLTSTLKKVLSTDKGDNFVDVKDDIVYEISAGVNHPTGTLNADSIKDFAVFDDAPTDAFATISKDSVIESVTVGEGKNAVDLTNKTDETANYTVVTEANTTDNAFDNTDQNADKHGLAAGHTRILVKFTPAGLGKIADALNYAQKNKKDEPQVHVKFKFQLNKDYKGGTAPTDPNTQEENGHNKIVNKSGFFKAHAGNAGKDSNPIISGDDDKGTATSTFGYLQVNKHDKKTGTGLSDAEFKLFNSKEKADACNAALLKEATEQKAATTQPAGDASTTTPADPCTDGASKNFNGTTTDGGKFQSAFKALAGQTIYLVEMKAPENYMRYPGAVAVSLKEGETTTVDFPNTKIEDTGINTPWFNLPATGAAGVILFALAGMGLIAASVFLYMRNRKEEEQQQNA